MFRNYGVCSWQIMPKSGNFFPQLFSKSCLCYENLAKNTESFSKLFLKLDLEGWSLCTRPWPTHKNRLALTLTMVSHTGHNSEQIWGRNGSPLAYTCHRCTNVWFVWRDTWQYVSIARPPSEPPEIQYTRLGVDPTQLWYGWLLQINSILVNIGRKTPFKF